MHPDTFHIPERITLKELGNMLASVILYFLAMPLVLGLFILSLGIFALGFIIKPFIWIKRLYAKN